jgi:uncharacterized protein YifE (UPF0438 family)
LKPSELPPDHRAYWQAGEFPLGVKRVSIFPDEELALLRKHGHWMQALALGRIQPLTEAQRRFVEVAAGKAKPEAVHERAWVRLMTRREYESEPHQVIDAFDPAERWFPRSQCWINNQGRYP